jgi:hypothetical protein
MFIRLNLKGCGLADVDVVFRKLFADIHYYYDFFFVVWGTHP